MIKKKLLFIYKGMVMGGSTTSLLSVLQEMDYSHYDVDLLMFQPENSDLLCEIPNSVNVLSFAYSSKLPLRIRKLFSIRSWLALLSRGDARYKEQKMQQALVSLSNKLDKEYDVAISFLEGWSLYYLVDNVKATRKVAWIHINYSEVGYHAELDKKYFSAIDNFALVSSSCVKNFEDNFADIGVRASYIPNILSSKVIKKKSEEKVKQFISKDDEKKIKFISVCRLACNHKGLDRAVKAFAKLKQYANRYIWYIIGDGDDREYLQNLISDKGLLSNIHLLGSRNNPYPYIKDCDIFLLPSHYEGKPMAVTEAQILGLVPCVTNYSSAKEQVHHMKDGIIMDNNDKAIEQTLYDILNGKIDIDTLKERVVAADYSNVEDMKLVMSLIEG